MDLHHCRRLTTRVSMTLTLMKVGKREGVFPAGTSPGVHENIHQVTLSVALRSQIVEMGDRRATVLCMQKIFDLRRRYFVTRFDSHFLNSSSKSELHKIGDIYIYRLHNKTNLKISNLWPIFTNLIKISPKRHPKCQWKINTI